MIARFGHPITYPRDCDGLAQAIHTATGQLLSASTLKRFFGLVPSEGGPSRFTRDVLTAYAADHLPLAPAEPRNPVWAAFAAAAARATADALAVVQAKCGLPWEHTVPRAFAAEHLARFADSGRAATAFVAEGGYGKSVLLGHLAEALTAAGEVVWLLPARVLPDVPGGALAAWLWQTGAPGHPMPGAEAAAPPVWLLLDGLDEAAATPAHEDATFAVVVDAVAAQAATPWLRVVLTSRPTTWERLRQTVLARAPRLTAHWFGVSFDTFSGQLGNVPPLSAAEQRQVLGAALPAAGGGALDELAPDTRALLGHPFYLQSLVARAETAGAHTAPGRLDLLQLMLRRRVYETRFSFEKTELLADLLTLTDYGRAGWSVPRARLDTGAGQRPGAYAELLAAGVLREETHLTPWQTVETRVCTGHDTLLEYLVARHLVEASGGYRHDLAARAATDYAASGHRPEVLKWLVLFGLREGAWAELAHLFRLDLPDSELNALSHFLGLELRADSAAAVALVPLLAAEPGAQTYFFERFVDLANLNRGYADAIGHYLRHKTTPEARLFGHCLRHLAAVLAADAPARQAALVAVRAVPLTADIHPFPRGRRAAAEILNAHLEGGAPYPLAVCAAEARALHRPCEPITGFAAGYQYFVAEALLLTRRHADLLAWAALTRELYPALPSDNLFTQLLSGYEAVARHRCYEAGEPSEAAAARALFATLTLRPLLAGYTWFKDYYEPLVGLIEAEFAPDAAARAARLAEVAATARARRMPWLAAVALG